MAQKKLQRFAAIKAFANVLEYPESMKGNWGSFFKVPQQLVLELACGRGEYTIALAHMFPEINVVGVDVKGNRIYIGARKGLEMQLTNAAFLRTQIGQLPDYFSPEEVDEIWITFPDPQLRTSRAKKRLTHPRFLRLYQQILRPGGYLHLKTDSPQLYLFTKKVIELYNLELVEDLNDVYASSPSALLQIKTHYEALDIAGTNTIFYLKFRLPSTLPDLDDDLQVLLKETENQPPTV